MLLSHDAKDQINRPVVLSEQVTTILQKAIFDGSIKEGEQLIEAELQLSLSVSRSPLREAFRELERRGFVEIKPRLQNRHTVERETLFSKKCQKYLFKWKKR